MNTDGSRGMGVKGANVVWGANAGVRSGWSKGRHSLHMREIVLQG